MKKSVLFLVLFTLTFASAQNRNPYVDLPKVPAFTITSTDISSGSHFATAQMSKVFGAGGEDRSPAITWSGFPQTTKSFVVTVYDPDAPTASGFWHWAVVNLPLNCTTLPSGAGSLESKLLPAGSFQLPNDARIAGFIGAAPPKGHGVHHYYIVVHAVDVDQLEIPKEATPAYLGFMLFTHTVGRAVLIATAQR